MLVVARVDAEHDVAGGAAFEKGAALGQAQPIVVVPGEVTCLRRAVAPVAQQAQGQAGVALPRRAAAEGARAAFGINRALTREDFTRRASGSVEIDHPGPT